MLVTARFESFVKSSNANPQERIQDSHLLLPEVDLAGPAASIGELGAVPQRRMQVSHRLVVGTAAVLDGAYIS